MSFLFDKVIFGPISSRRLGLSLGVNLLPVNKKICSFDCIYCECGLNGELGDKKGAMPTHKEVAETLEKHLLDMKKQNQLPDVITFAGNGEPTLHPYFHDIIDSTIILRNKIAPNARIAVLSNASKLDDENIFAALCKVDDNIQKLDAATVEAIQQIDRPNKNYSMENTIQYLAKFDGNVIIQTLFIRGNIKNETIDNTTEYEVEKWIEALEKIRPKQVMIYTISRPTPYSSLEKISIEELQQISDILKERSFNVLVSS